MQNNNDFLEVYDREYIEILGKMEKGVMTPLEIGVAINRFTLHSNRINLAVGDLNRAYKRVKADMGNTSDPDTGKKITSTKAETQSEATDEYFARDIAERHLVNCNNCVMSLKSLLKAMSRAEYAG